MGLSPRAQGPQVGGLAREASSNSSEDGFLLNYLLLLVKTFHIYVSKVHEKAQELPWSHVSSSLSERLCSDI